MGWGVVDWIRPAQKRDKWPACCAESYRFSSSPKCQKCLESLKNYQLLKKNSTPRDRGHCG